MIFGRKVSIGFQVGTQAVVRFDDVRISFEVTKDDGSAPNHAHIKVYGLSRSSAASLQASNLRVYLWASYGDYPPALLFLGDITKVTTTHEGTERITEIESGDGQEAIKTTSLSKSYAGPTNPSDMIGDLVGSLADKLGIDPNKAKRSASRVVKNLTPDRPEPRGAVLTGNAGSTLSKICKANGLDWTIRDGELIVVKPGFAEQGEAFSLTPSSGLIGSPILGNEGRLEVKALLNAELRPLKLVQVKAREHDGFYVIRRVKHSGDSGWDREFYTVLECTEVPE